MFDAYALVQAQDQLKLGDEQYPPFLSRFKALQEIRRRAQAERGRIVQDSGACGSTPSRTMAAAEGRIKALQELDVRTAADIRRAQTVDQVLDCQAAGAVPRLRGAHGAAEDRPGHPGPPEQPTEQPAHRGAPRARFALAAWIATGTASPARDTSITPVCVRGTDMSSQCFSVVRRWRDRAARRSACLSAAAGPSREDCRVAAKQKVADIAQFGAPSGAPAAPDDRHRARSQRLSELRRAGTRFRRAWSTRRSPSSVAGRVSGRAVVDLDAVRKQNSQRSLFDPMNFAHRPRAGHRDRHSHNQQRRRPFAARNGGDRPRAGAEAGSAGNRQLLLAHAGEPPGSARRSVRAAGADPRDSGATGRAVSFNDSRRIAHELAARVEPSSCSDRGPTASLPSHVPTVRA